MLALQLRFPRSERGVANNRARPVSSCAELRVKDEGRVAGAMFGSIIGHSYDSNEAPMTDARKPISIRYETERAAVRPLTADDATPRVGAWLGDAHTARMLNVPARALGVEELKSYFATHDGVETHILGIFDKASGAHIGIYTIYVDWDRREFLTSLLIGERGPDGAGIGLEAARPALKIMFEDLDMLAARGSTLARNERVKNIYASRGVAPEHVSLKASVHQEAPEELLHYTITRDVWRELHRKRMEKERLAREQRQKAS